MEAELNENCPSNLYPAIGMRSHGGTVCICLLDCSKWGSADDDAGMKPIQVDTFRQWLTLVPVGSEVDGLGASGRVDGLGMMLGFRKVKLRDDEEMNVFSK